MGARQKFKLSELKRNCDTNWETFICVENVPESKLKNLYKLTESVNCVSLNCCESTLAAITVVLNIGIREGSDHTKLKIIYYKLSAIKAGIVLFLFCIGSGQNEYHYSKSPCPLSNLTRAALIIFTFKKGTPHGELAILGHAQSVNVILLPRETKNEIMQCFIKLKCSK